MYYSIVGRGATLNDLDASTIQQMYPISDTPPFSFDRILNAITVGVNTIELRGYDLQGDKLSIELGNPTPENSDKGEFFLNGTMLEYTAFAPFPDSTHINPGSEFSWQSVKVKFSEVSKDNASPPIEVRILRYFADTYPAPNGDGLPDSWMEEYFSNPDPSAGANRGPDDDWDEDSFTNHQEYLIGSDPTNPNSNLFISEPLGGSLTWVAKPYELYEIQSTTDFSNWRYVRAIVPTLEEATIKLYPSELKTTVFFRIMKVK